MQVPAISCLTELLAELLSLNLSQTCAAGNAVYRRLAGFREHAHTLLNESIFRAPAVMA